MSEKIIEKIAKAVRPAIDHAFRDECLTAKGKRVKACILDLAEDTSAKAALSVIRENASELVKPLVWYELGDKWGTVTSGRIQITRSGSFPSWDLSCSSPEKDGCYLTLEDAKAAAQEHHVSRVLSLLNMEGE